MNRFKRSLFLLVPLVLLGACNRQDAEPPVVPEPATQATFALETADAVGAKNTYVSFPLSLSSAENAAVYGFDVMVNYDTGLELVTVTTGNKGVVTELSDLEGQYAQLSALSDVPLTRLDLNLVARVTSESDARVRFSEPEVLLADGSVQATTKLATASFTLGEGGQPTAPKGSTLEARAEALRGALPGTAQASTLRSYSVPTVMDAAWVEREQGDLNQDGKVNIRDAQILLKALLGKAELDAYQRMSADLLDDQKVDKQDFVALVLKKAFARSKHKLAVMSVHPQEIDLTSDESGVLLIGNAGNHKLDVKLKTDAKWLEVKEIKTKVKTSTLGYRLTLKSSAKTGDTTELTLTEKNGQVRTVKVSVKEGTGSRPPTDLPDDVDVRATTTSGFGDLVITAAQSALQFEATNVNWNSASHTLSADITVANVSETQSFEGARLIADAFDVSSISAINPDGYTADDLAFFDLGALAPSDTITQTWRFHSPEDRTFSVDFSLIETNTAFNMFSASPSSFRSDRGATVTIQGEGFRAETAFFIQSTKLEVKSWSESQVRLEVPAGFAPASYGLMAVNPDGNRTTLYPTFTITEALAPAPLDPKVHAFSYVDGYVFDYVTEEPIAGAVVSLPGLEAITGPTGYFAMRGVPRGRQAVKIEAEGYEPVYRFAEVYGDQQTVTVDLALLEPIDPAVTYIGPEGGVHYASNGAFLEVPEGALSKTVPMQFTHTRSAATLPELPDDSYYLAFAHLGPSGLTFSKPATLFLPLQEGVIVPTGTPINISYFDEKDKRWVQDITKGVITDIDGQLYLEYEINHFTWIGGQWIPPVYYTVSGCVQYDDGRMAVGVSSTGDTTSSTGRISYQVRESSVGRNVGISAVDAFGKIHYKYKYWSGKGNIDVGCITLPSPRPVNVSRPTIRTSADECSSSGSDMVGYGFSQPNGHASPDSMESLSSNGLELVVADSLYDVRARIASFNSMNIDLSTMRFFVGDRDVTAEVDFRFDRWGDVEAVYYFDGPPPAGSGLEIKFSADSKEGDRDARENKVDVVAGYQVPEVFTFTMPDELLANDVVTPYYETYGEALVAIFRESDVDSNGEVIVNVPVKAVDADGNTLPINRSESFYFRSEDFSVFDEINGSSGMTNGEALVPVKMPAYGGEIFLDTLAFDDSIQSYNTIRSMGSGGGCAGATTPSGGTPSAQSPSEEEQKGFYSSLRNFYDGLPLIITVPSSLIPFLIDGVDAAVYGPGCISGNTGDCIVTGIAAVGLTTEITGVGTLTSVANQFYKISRKLVSKGGGAFYRAIEELWGKYQKADGSLDRSRDAQLIQELQELMGAYVDISKANGLNPLTFEKTIENADILATRLAKDSSDSDAIKAVGAALKDATAAGVDGKDFLALATSAKKNVDRIELDDVNNWLSSGRLKRTGDKVFESAEGLQYGPGSYEKHRIAHVLNHAADDVGKEAHGVFQDGVDPFKLIDDAWATRKSSGNMNPDEISPTNGNFVYEIDLAPRITGKSGGKEGVANGNKETTKVTIVLDPDGKTVVSAYPSL